MHQTIRDIDLASNGSLHSRINVVPSNIVIQDWQTNVVLNISIRNVLGSVENRDGAGLLDRCARLGKTIL